MAEPVGAMIACTGARDAVSRSGWACFVKYVFRDELFYLNADLKSVSFLIRRRTFLSLIFNHLLIYYVTNIVTKCNALYPEGFVLRFPGR